MLPEASLLARDPLQLLLGPLGIPLAQPLPLEVVLATETLHRLARMGFAVGITVGGDRGQTEIDAQGVGGGDWGPLGDVHRDNQGPLAGLASDEVGLPPGPPP